MGLIVHEEGCDAIRCTCNRPKTLKEVIEELEKKREETEIAWVKLISGTQQY